MKCPNRSASQFVRVKSIRKLENYASDSYCFYEPKKNRGVLNGVLTGNCVESFSPFKNTNPENEKPNEQVKELGYIHSCNLFSLNLPNLYENGILFDDKKLKEVMRLVVRYMDNIIDISTPPVEEIRNHNKLYRTIGIGFIGFADLMVKLSIDNNKLYTYRFTKKSNKNENLRKEYKDRIMNLVKKVFGRIAFYSIYASVELAKERGAFKKFKDTKWNKGILLSRYDITKLSINDIQEIFGNIPLCDIQDIVSAITKVGIRNSMLLNCPPNTSTSIYAGVSASILPVFNLFSMESQKNATYLTFPKYVEFPLFYDIYSQYDLEDMKDIIEIIAEIQKYIDSGISFEYPININIIKKENLPEYMFTIFKLSNELGIKALYYGRPITTQGKKEKDSCVACAN